ncbi:purine nucleoside permease [Acidisoma cellulosilytica]|uniref:Purine nucleoside permease n=1 Tax=Acidisoma cellulosilyticum TaxID=2802395 RepID=A0A963YYU9_9PROT|nr:purine nucleoside permease [Acidisoma cellulosilyticum]MCB8878663.1 purine nucleoside permease [Acidisoma cellulosilyticum]
MQVRTWLAGAAIGCMALSAGPVQAASPLPTAPPATPVKVMIVSMFGPEGGIWQKYLPLTEAILVPGLSPDYPAIHCATDGVCLLTTGMGEANAAASISALVYSHQFDLRKTYWLVAGIAGINPHDGTIGSAAWARYLVSWGLQWELDEREAPKTWPSGYTGINTTGPDQKPPLDYKTEVFQLNEALLDRAYALSKGVALADAPAAQKARAAYPAPGGQPPTVIQCDTLAGDTWWSGTLLGERAEAWTKLLTDGKGNYCTTQQEDNATYEALTRATAAGLTDDSRVAVLRSGSDFDRPAPGGNDAANLLKYQDQGGFMIALENLYRAGNPLVQEIAGHWSAWENSVPND